MSDRYQHPEHNEPDALEQAMSEHAMRFDLGHAELVYEHARTVLEEAGLPWTRAVALAERIRSKVMGL